MTQHIPSLPKNVDPRIVEILRQRAEQGVTIRETQPAGPLPPVSMQERPAPAPQVVILSDTDLAAQLEAVLPKADALIRQTVRDVRSDGRLTLVEAIALASEIRNIASQVVGEMLPHIKGQSAADLVSLLLAVLIKQYVSPHLPAFLRGLITTQLIRAMVATLQTAYETWVKPKLQAQRLSPAPVG